MYLSYEIPRRKEVKCANCDEKNFVAPGPETDLDRKCEVCGKSLYREEIEKKTSLVKQVWDTYESDISGRPNMIVVDGMEDEETAAEYAKRHINECENKALAEVNQDRFDRHYEKLLRHAENYSMKPAEIRKMGKHREAFEEYHSIKSSNQHPQEIWRWGNKPDEIIKTNTRPLTELMKKLKEPGKVIRLPKPVVETVRTFESLTPEEGK